MYYNSYWLLTRIALFLFCKSLWIKASAKCILVQSTVICHMTISGKLLSAKVLYISVLNVGYNTKLLVLFGNSRFVSTAAGILFRVLKVLQ